MPLVTPTLENRAASTTTLTSSTTSFSCSGKNAHDSQCEKPASNNGLEIGLGVGIPVFLILCVLSLFMFKNYRKEKKEAMEHDPDFDETGDATALPDFPAFSKEDPFQNRSSVNIYGANGGYPLMNLPNRLVNDLGSIASPAKNDDSAHVDAFVLPYLNQLGSKASLHEFARSLTDMRLYHNRRTSDYLNFTGGVLNGMNSPKKPASSGKMHMRTDSTGVRAFGTDYSQLPNKSTPLLANEAFFPAKEIAGDTSGETSGDTTSSQSRSDGQFGVEYENEGENEREMTLNTTLPSSKKNFTLLKHLAPTTPPQVQVHPESDLESVNDLETLDDEKECNISNAHTVPSFDILSPFEDKHASEPELGHKTDTDVLHMAPTTGTVREPRISQFDMLQNISDDEDEGVAHETPLTLQKKMSDEQEEELARMKSVYKVYFDRSNSVASHRDKENGGTQFHADPSQPLPAIDVDHLKVNSELRADTAYDKRKTTTSSIYEDGLDAELADGHVVHPYQQFNLPPKQAQNPPPPQSLSQYPPGQVNAQYAPMPAGSNGPQSHEPPLSPEDYLPLKSLPNASDIRNSTLETFTLYQPTLKVSSPSLRQQNSGYFDVEGGSPHMNSQASFATSGLPRIAHLGELPPMLRDPQATNGATPSASQLSRASVVMLNPVNEITSLRKFKPAGSLPSGMVSPHPGYSNDELATGDDLVPGNRKSAVRRMMNSNF